MEFLPRSPVCDLWRASHRDFEQRGSTAFEYTRYIVSFSNAGCSWPTCACMPISEWGRYAPFVCLPPLSCVFSWCVFVLCLWCGARCVCGRCACFVCMIIPALCVTWCLINRLVHYYYCYYWWGGPEGKVTVRNARTRVPAVTGRLALRRGAPRQEASSSEDAAGSSRQEGNGGTPLCGSRSGLLQSNEQPPPSAPTDLPPTSPRPRSQAARAWPPGAAGLGLPLCRRPSPRHGEVPEAAAARGGVGRLGSVEPAIARRARAPCATECYY